MIPRRLFLKASTVTALGLMLPWRDAQGQIQSQLFFPYASKTEQASAVFISALTPQIPLPGSAIAQFVDPLPIPHIIAANDQLLELQMTEFQSQVLPATFVPANGLPYTGTHVWGYLEPAQTTIPSYIGPVIVATRGEPTEIKWVNNLPNAAQTNVLAYRYSTDQTLHWADPLNQEANHCAHMGGIPAFGSDCAQNYAGPVPAVVHLHGGEVPATLDGGPDAWFTSDGQYYGHAFYSKDGIAATNYAIYRYPNSQEAAPIWFHDHTLGATRLNVYAGLAGGYLITDPINDPENMPPLVPLVIQDRRFDINGELFFPAASAGGVQWSPNPEHPYWVPEFVGDVICVNGKAWPFLQVEPKRYRFLFLNGSNARTYEMFLTNPVSKEMGPAMWQVGTDGGYLDSPVKIDPNAPKGQLQRLVLMPGERADVIIDFAGLLPGTILTLRNIAKTPYPGGTPPHGATTGLILQLRIAPLTAPDTSYDPALLEPLRSTPMVRLANPATGALAAGVHAQKNRQLTLNEVMAMPQTAIDPVTGALTNYPGGPLEVLVNNTKWDGKRPDGVPVSGGVADSSGLNYVSERPHEGETEIWEIINLTADAHPIHLHLVQFQLMNRQSFDVKKYTAAYNAAFPGGMLDPMTGQPYPAGVYIPGFGPPLDYTTGNPTALGGNPNITPYLKGPVKLPAPNEAGWKDTVTMLPGEVTRIVVRWTPTDLAVDLDPQELAYPFNPNSGHGYVWHCHIIDHEDNEMMRPTSVIPRETSRTYVMGTDF